MQLCRLSDYELGGSFMKLAFINPNESGQWFRLGSLRKCGKWTYSDEMNSIGQRVRYVAHHTTVMGFFTEREPNVWVFLPISTGWGSASDQQGMNKIMGSEWKYRRNGGNPR
jgi:hypothetical protein